MAFELDDNIIKYNKRCKGPIISRGYKRKYRIKKRQLDIEVDVEVKTPVINTTNTTNTTTTSIPTITITNSNNPTNTIATPTNQQPHSGGNTPTTTDPTTTDPATTDPATTDNPVPFGKNPLPEPDNPITPSTPDNPDNPDTPDTPDTPDDPSDSIPTNIPPNNPEFPKNPPKTPPPDTPPPDTPPPDTPKTNSGDNDNNNNNNNNDNNNNDNNNNNNNNNNNDNNNGNNDNSNGNDDGNNNNDNNNNNGDGDDNGSNNYSSTVTFNPSTIIPSLTSTIIPPTNVDGNPATVPPTNTSNPSDKGKIFNPPSGPAIIGMIFAIIIALVAIVFIIRKTVYNKDYFRPFTRNQNRRRLLDNEDSENWSSFSIYNNTNDVEVVEGNNNIASSSSMDATDVLIKPKRTRSRSSSSQIFDDITNFNSSNTGLLIDYDDELSYSSGNRQEELASNRSSLSTILIPPKIVNWEECMR